MSWAESSEGQGGRRRQVSSPQQSRPQRKRIPNQNAFILTSAPGDLGALLPSEDRSKGEGLENTIANAIAVVWLRHTGSDWGIENSWSDI